MRINVYSQEITTETTIVEKTADTGITYYGVRIYLASPDVLHHTPDDDDRSAITFWLPSARKFNKDDLEGVFRNLAQLVHECPGPRIGPRPVDDVLEGAPSATRSLAVLGYLWTDPKTGQQRRLAPEDVVAIVPAREPRRKEN